MTSCPTELHSIGKSWKTNMENLQENHYCAYSVVLYWCFTKNLIKIFPNNLTSPLEKEFSAIFFDISAHPPQSITWVFEKPGSLTTG